MEESNLCKHIAIIMDGNGRWAKNKGLPRSAGHKKGAETLQEIAKAIADLGVECLTVYAFSTENWNRSDEEVNFASNSVEFGLGVFRNCIKLINMLFNFIFKKIKFSCIN